ncbi:MAG: cspA [Thermoleophilia bacterium]|nr:cspA [Thermoleophilia bacterium]
MLLASVQLWALALVPSLRAQVASTPAVVLRTVDAPNLTSRSARPTVELPIRADMVGASWVGATRGLQLRARGGDGQWSRWLDLEDEGDAPDPTSREARALRGRHALTTPMWVGDADRVQLRTRTGFAPVRDVRLTAVNVTGTATASTRLATRARSTAARVLGVASTDSASAVPMSPGIHLRSSWAAGPAIASPLYAGKVEGVVIHHTVNTNNYSCASVPAMLRGIQRAHQRSNGWNDIGYNFLVDRCGGVWEGRGGGIIRPVIGAHSAGFNTGTVGIALIGTYSSSKPTKQQLAAVDKLVAWRLDMGHVQASGPMTLIARSSDKFAVGTKITRKAVVGHRDLFPTACPGAVAYRELAGIGARAARLGGLKVMNVQPSPTIDPVTGEVSRLAIRSLTNARGATSVVSVERSSDGRVIATRSVTGIGVRLDLGDSDLRVDGALPRVWDLRVRVSATTPTLKARPALVDLAADYGASPGFAVVAPPAASVTPAAPAPDDQLHVGFTLATRASVGAWLRDPATGARAYTLVKSAIHDPALTPEQLDIGIPAAVPAGTWILEVGNEYDPAPGRSVVRSTVTVVR